MRHDVTWYTQHWWCNERVMQGLRIISIILKRCANSRERNVTMIFVVRRLKFSKYYFICQTCNISIKKKEKYVSFVIFSEEKIRLFHNCENNYSIKRVKWQRYLQMERKEININLVSQLREKGSPNRASCRTKFFSVSKYPPKKTIVEPSRYREKGMNTRMLRQKKEKKE